MGSVLATGGGSGAPLELNFRAGLESNCSHLENLHPSPTSYSVRSLVFALLLLSLLLLLLSRRHRLSSLLVASSRLTTVAANPRTPSHRPPFVPYAAGTAPWPWTDSTRLTPAPGIWIWICARNRREVVRIKHCNSVANSPPHRSLLLSSQS